MNSAIKPALWGTLEAWTSRAAEPAAVAGRAGPTWSLQRPNVLTPRQLGACVVLLVFTSGCVGAFFWAMGAAWVSLFSGIEALVVVIAFAWHATHAADGERLAIVGHRLVVEVRRGLGLARHTFDLQSLTVVPCADGRLELRCAGRVLEVGSVAAASARRRALVELQPCCGAVARREGEAL